MVKDEALENVKGMVPFPCGCGSEAVVYKGATGQISVPCRVCGRFALFDQDRMIAIPAKPLKGASHKFKSGRLSPSRLGP